MGKDNLKTDTVRQLLSIMDDGDLSAIRYTDGDFKIELERDRFKSSAGTIPIVAERVRDLISAGESLTGITEGAASAPVASDNESSVTVKSPMVGTFYAGPSPDEDPFVKVGQEVLSGQTLAIVEAMKMMNEITAPTPGIITEIFASNGTQVEYDQPLFRISTEASAQ